MRRAAPKEPRPSSTTQHRIKNPIYIKVLLAFRTHWKGSVGWDEERNDCPRECQAVTERGLPNEPSPNREHRGTAIVSNVRCYLIAEPPADLSAVRTVLSDLDIEVIEPGRAFDTASDTSRGWIPDVDFVCAIFSAELRWETPASLFLEIGQAIGAGVPVVLVAEPPRRLDAALFPLPIVRIPVTNKPALATHLRLFLQSVGQPLAAMAPPRAPNPAELGVIRNELIELRSHAAHTVNGESAQWIGQRIEEIALRLFRAAGADAQETTHTDGIGDFAAWVPGTERFIPGPLLVELKMVRHSQIDRAVLDQLQLYAMTRDAPWSVLLYYRLDAERIVRLPKGGAWPTVMVFDIEELALNLREQTLAQILNNERNAIVHGVGPT
jgi:hypothetical protein